MDVIAKLIRLLQDDYKVGAEMRSGKPVIYVDPNKFDAWRLDRDNSRKDNNGIASQLAEQLDSQYPGISKKFTTDELVFLTKESLQSGPFSRKLEKTDSPICLLNEAKGDEIKVGKIYDTFGFNETFNPSHLIPLPGSNSEWAQLVGEHEGEHCNQDPIYNTDKDAEVKVLDGEAKSDRAAIETLLKEGKGDIIAAWKAVRAINAANGDTSHATSIFFDDPEFKGVTAEHLDAAKRFSEEMNMGVAENLGITVDEAEILRKADPQKYVTTVEDALKNGQLPALRNKSEEGVMVLVAKEMGLSPDEAEKVTDLDAKKVSDIYQKLKENGSLQDRGTPNPHINKYIQSYIDGTKVLFVKDTTPSAIAAPKTAAKEESPETKPTDEEVAAKKEEDLQKDADKEAYLAMDEIVEKALGLSTDELAELYDKDPDKYYDTVEKELQKGTTTLQTSRDLPQDQINELIAKKLGIPLEDVDSQPSFILKMADNELRKEGSITTKQDNPYLKAKLEDEIKSYRESKLESMKADVSSDEATKPATSDSTQGFKSSAEPLIKTDQKLTSSFTGAAANRPAQPTPDQGVEITNPALQQRVAQNSSPYLSAGNG